MGRSAIYKLIYRSFDFCKSNSTGSTEERHVAHSVHLAGSKSKELRDYYEKCIKQREIAFGDVDVDVKCIGEDMNIRIKIKNKVEMERKVRVRAELFYVFYTGIKKDNKHFKDMTFDEFTLDPKGGRCFYFSHTLFQFFVI